jgi:hypothetical protein
MKTSILSAALLICICFKLYAQQPIDQLIATEKKFAATSKEQTTKIAFLSFLDSNCVGFNNGEQVNLFEVYSKRKEDSSKLTWAPEFAIISSSEDMGVTTGPWEYWQSSLKDTPVAHGHFATIWQKNNKGEWKAVFDMGINHAAPVTKSQMVTELILIKHTTKDKQTTSTLTNVDLNFSDAFEIDKKYAAGKVTNNDSWLTINDNMPVKGVAAINNFLNTYAENIKFSLPEYSVFSKEMDMFAMCGKAETGSKKQAYMRVWIKQNNEWNLLMMMIR